MAGKLTDIQIRNLRKVWEADPRPGVAWLVKEKKLPVTRQYLDKVAKTQGWKKIRVAVQELLTDKNVEKRVAQALKKNKETAATKKTKQPATAKVPINQGFQEEETVGPLQLKEEQFVRAYVSNFNVVEASKMAHIGKHTGYALIKKDYIQKRIAELMKPRAEKLGLDADAFAIRRMALRNGQKTSITPRRRSTTVGDSTSPICRSIRLMRANGGIGLCRRLPTARTVTAKGSLKSGLRTRAT